MPSQNPSQSKLSAVWTLFVLLIVTALLTSGCGAAQQNKVYHIGVLSGLDAFGPAVNGLKAKMTELGYIEGKNITYDVQSLNVDTDAYQKAVQKFVTDKVDLIYVFPTEAAAIAKTVTKGTNIPVVFVLSFTDVKGIDLIDSISAPGGNITGVRFPSADIASKRLQILNQIAPNAKRILVPYLKDYPNVPGQMDVLRPQAQSMGVQLVEIAAASPQDLQAELDRRAASSDLGVDAILMIAEPLGITPVFFDILGKFSFDHKLPIGGAMMTTSDGSTSSVFGLLPDAQTAGEQSALVVDKVLKGTPAGTIAVGTEESYFQINYKAAQMLGLTVPEGLLKMADKVIK